MGDMQLWTFLRAALQDVDPRACYFSTCSAHAAFGALKPTTPANNPCCAVQPPAWIAHRYKLDALYLPGCASLGELAFKSSAGSLHTDPWLPVGLAPHLRTCWPPASDAAAMQNKQTN